MKVETAYGLLVRRRWYDYTGVIMMQLGVKPEKVTISARDGKVWSAVCFGGRLGRSVLMEDSQCDVTDLCADLIDCVTTSQVSNLVRVADCNVKGRLCSLLDRDVRG